MAVAVAPYIMDKMERVITILIENIVSRHNSCAVTQYFQKKKIQVHK